MNMFPFVATVALSLALSGSALADEPTSQPTTTVDVASATASLVGTWEADMSTFQMDVLDAMSDVDRQQIMAMLLTGVMRLTNNADGSYSSFNRNPMNGEEYTETGTWQVTGVEGDLVGVRTNEANDTRGPDEVDAEPDDVGLRIINADTLMMVDQDEEGGAIRVQLNRL